MEADRPPCSSVELFTGAGGLALATHDAGFRHVRLCEWNADACDTLRTNAARTAVPGVTEWGTAIVQRDVASVDFTVHRGVDLLVGGPPCQPFSLGGRHGGREDARDMIPQFIRAIRETQPRAFIMENVRGLTRKSFSAYLNFSVLQMSYPDITRKTNEDWEKHWQRLQRHHAGYHNRSELSYHVEHQVLNAADHGVPQCRERIFIVGFRGDTNIQWSFPKPTHTRDALFFDQWIVDDYWVRNGITRPIPSEQVENRIKAWGRRGRPATRPWATIRDAITDLPAPFHEKDDDPARAVFNHRFQAGARPYPGHTGSPFDQPSKTLKAGGHGVPGGENMIVFPDATHRYMTVREAARIQTFPDAWRFAGSWSEAMRQIGNAVPVRLAEAVVRRVRQALDDTPSPSATIKTEQDHRPCHGHRSLSDCGTIKDS